MYLTKEAPMANGGKGDTGLGYPRDELLRMYRKMLEIRHFEEKVFELLGKDLIKGASHVYAGEEAVATGAIAALREDDLITSTHRGHGHCLAKGGELKPMFAELCGKKTGYCKGRGGSMHIADVSKGNLGATGIVGSNIPVAVGAGLTQKLLRTGRVVVCFFGDGAANTGAFHESLNLASIWKLPVLFLCENNLYAMSVPFRKAFNIDRISIRAVAYGIPGRTVDGMDVLEVRRAVEEMLVPIRAGEGPALLEAMTYRYYGHSRSDPRKYRTREEEAEYRARDPIKKLARQLIEAGLATQEELDVIEQEVVREVDEAAQYGLESPYPDPSELFDDLYV